MSNGRIERCLKEVLRVLRSLCSENAMHPDQWIHLLPLVQHSLNHSRLPSLADNAPITVMCGRPPSSPMNAIWTPTGIVQLSDASVRNIPAYITTLRAELDALLTTIQSKPRCGPASPTANPVLLNPGDFVLVAHLGSQRRHKALPSWRGPARVIEATDASNLVYRIFDFVTNKESIAHAQFLRLYCDRLLEVTPQLKRFAAHCGTGDVLLAITDYRLEPSAEFKCSWEGYEVADETWQSAVSIFHDAPVMTRQFVKRISNKADRLTLERLLFA